MSQRSSDARQRFEASSCRCRRSGAVVGRARSPGARASQSAASRQRVQSASSRSARVGSTVPIASRRSGAPRASVRPRRRSLRQRAPLTDRVRERRGVVEDQVRGKRLPAQRLPAARRCGRACRDRSWARHAASHARRASGSASARRSSGAPSGRRSGQSDASSASPRESTGPSSPFHHVGSRQRDRSGPSRSGRSSPSFRSPCRRHPDVPATASPCTSSME